MQYIPPAFEIFWQPRERPCCDCPALFLATAPNAVRCAACRERRKADVQVKAQARFDAKRKARRLA